MQPDVHVVIVPPVVAERKGRDILSALRKMQANTEKAEQIAAAGQELVQSILTPEIVQR